MEKRHDVRIKFLSRNEVKNWDNYVLSHPYSTLYHLSTWRNIIRKGYGHKTYYLIATKCNLKSGKNYRKQTFAKPLEPSHPPETSESIVGLLPLVHLRHVFFGNSLISMPFFDYGGVLADEEDIGKALLDKALKLGEELRVRNIELRQIGPVPGFNGLNSSTSENSPATTSEPICGNFVFQTSSHKVRMVLELPDSSDTLMQSFKSKLRSQIKRPLKEGLYPRIGGLELLDDFYEVFSINMRDLGSPVHSKSLIRNVIAGFPERAKFVVIYKQALPVASSLMIGFKDFLNNPWASALRTFNRMSPNMLLYWSMFEYAVDKGYSHFDLGRSSPEEGTFRFKRQWGALPTPLHWHYISLNHQPMGGENHSKSDFDKAINYWKRLPVPLTKLIGPMIRKHIGL
jgi:hypothetical protein